MLDIQAIKTQFPILERRVHGKPLVYLDNAATTQKPQCVIDAEKAYYEQHNANVHRGSHTLGAEATAAYEAARDYVADFIKAPSSKLINFTRGTTESINLVAHSWSAMRLRAGDEILVSELEHHSNIVPWQLAAQQYGATVRPIPILDDGSIDQAAFESMLSDRTAMVSVNYVSNALGTINPVKDMIRAAQKVGAHTMIDAAQASAHIAIDVQELDCDFLCFSGHKAYGPMGIGVLYGKDALLNAMPPYMGGGEMIQSVSFEGTTFNQLPYKFEAGTPYVAGAVGLHRALQFIQECGVEALAKHEDELLQGATKRLSAIDGLHIHGTAAHKAAVISFTVDGVHNYDLAVLLDKQGIAVRDGHHCCEPLMHRLQVEGTCRASFAAYNTMEDVEALEKGLQRAINMLR